MTLRQRSASPIRIRYTPGATGPAGTIEVGTVTTGAPGSSAAITNSGTDKAAILNFTIPRGDVGAANELEIGTVSTLPFGAPATASITGTAPNQTLNLGLPQGEQGPSGSVTDGGKGDITVSSAGTVWTVDANTIDDTKFRQSAGLSVVGRSADSTGNVADLTAGTDGHVLRRSGTSLGFGTVAPAGLDRSYLELAGGALTGALTLARDARSGLEAAPSRALEGFVSGLEVSTDGSNAITVSPGVCVAGGMVMRLASTMTKQINVTWSAGSGGSVGCLDAGSEASNTAYYVSIIGNPTTGAVDFIASASASSPTLPSGWTVRLDLMVVFNDGSANLRSITNIGDEVYFTAAPIQDYTNTSFAGGARTLVPLTLPARRCLAIINCHFFAGGTAGAVWVTSPDNTDFEPAVTTGRATGYLAVSASLQFSDLRVSTATGQVGVRFGTGMSGGQVYVATVGFVYPRGRA
ncbi:MAG TPA: hypothetical protein VGV17_15965 [Bosea sp. (in: a-proteobacteria)]|jgi:hypothetical protein|uniref:hypothetical protein n=1 Tax=Bosea sp. (in: a-proteobacteria) TaxID=1871050 RepID=UPI002DDC91AE|nr:hypothetical protein [Bosea sp. (in: a-proteobacteria)]HEV2555251.1 hypothetical protein [Bosea sp. (in: a-proteobacteria)]